MEEKKLMLAGLSRNWPGHAICAAALLFFTGLFFAVNAEAQVFRIQPSILVSEEYNDNIFLQGRGNERIYAYVTRLAPSVNIKYTTSFWDWDVNYTYDYYYYVYKSGNEEDQTHSLDLRNVTEILKDHLFVRVLDTYHRVSRDIAIDYTAQSPSAYQVDQNIFTVNPYLLLRPSQSSRLWLGYMFVDTRYLNGSSRSDAQTIDHVDHIGYSELGMNLSSRLTVTVGGRYVFDRNRDENYSRYKQMEVYAGPQYNYTEQSHIYARGGKTWFEFQPTVDSGQTRPRKEYWFWDGGLNHRMSTITLGLNARRYVAQDPLRLVTLADAYTATITKTEPRYLVSLGGGFFEYRDATADQRLSKSRQVFTTLLYRFTPTTSGTANASFQEVQSFEEQAGVTKLILASVRLDHRLSEKASLAFDYRYANSHSYDIIANNYFNNRYILEFRYAF